MCTARDTKQKPCNLRQETGSLPKSFPVFVKPTCAASDGSLENALCSQEVSFVVSWAYLKDSQSLETKCQIKQPNSKWFTTVKSKVYLWNLLSIKGF